MNRVLKYLKKKKSIPVSLHSLRLISSILRSPIMVYRRRNWEICWLKLAIGDQWRWLASARRHGQSQDLLGCIFLPSCDPWSLFSIWEVRNIAAGLLRRDEGVNESRLKAQRSGDANCFYSSQLATSTIWFRHRRWPSSDGFFCRFYPFNPPPTPIFSLLHLFPHVPSFPPFLLKSGVHPS